jgi:hypothetical protein
MKLLNGCPSITQSKLPFDSLIIPKKAGTKNIEEFRQINTLSTFEKILECVVKELTEYLEQHNILVDVQSEFRKVTPVKLP